MIKKASNKKNILLVDNDHLAGETLAMLLKTRGYEVRIACCDKEVFEQSCEVVDLILVHAALSDRGGFEICRQLKEGRTTRETPVILLSARDSSEDIVEGLYLGADDYLTKPFEYEELVARMEAVMRRGPLLKNGSYATREEGVIIYEIRRIIEQELIVPFFQPIYLLNPLGVYGFEALGRPLTNNTIFSPEILFKLAFQFGLYHDLEMVSWKKAIFCATEFLEDKKLFLNCNPCLVEGQKFSTIETLFAHSPINPRNVILEITERSAISDFKTFYGYLNHYRDYGFKFAVDDVGGGYASLEAIVAIKPEVVKIDRHIVHELDTDPFKRSIIKFIVSFCREHGILSVAEGVERIEDLQILVELGVDAGQGYYLHRPSPQIPSLGIPRRMPPVFKI